MTSHLYSFQHLIISLRTLFSIQHNFTNNALSKDTEFLIKQTEKAEVPSILF